MHVSYCNCHLDCLTLRIFLRCDVSKDCDSINNDILKSINNFLLIFYLVEYSETVRIRKNVI